MNRNLEDIVIWLTIFSKNIPFHLIDDFVLESVVFCVCYLH